MSVRSVAASFLLPFAVQANNRETLHLADRSAKQQYVSWKRLADAVLDNFFDRAFGSTPSHFTDLDDTALGKRDYAPARRRQHLTLSKIYRFRQSYLAHCCADCEGMSAQTTRAALSRRLSSSGAENNGSDVPGCTAQDYKEQANELLKHFDYEGAAELYSKAIALDPSQAIYWANRAQANIRMELFGLAISDATEAVRLDPSYIKAYYRRAVGYMSILKPSAALDDLKTVMERAPHDKDARAKFNACRQIVRRNQFEDAICSPDAANPFQELNWKSIAVEDEYDGARLPDDGPMTFDFLMDMVSRFRDGKLLHPRYLMQILSAVHSIFLAEATLVDYDIREGSYMTVCGDTHGQFFDLLHIFETNGWPSMDHAYLFNGDLVDRGSWSTEIALVLYALKWLHPTTFFINRGNHETDEMNKLYGFEGECKAKYSEKAFKLFSESFTALPLATLISSRYLVLHGGLFSNDEVTLDDLRKLDRCKQRQPGMEGLMMEILWTDPQPEQGRGPSQRGVGFRFGPDVTKSFCERNNLTAVIRSHEVRMGGYEIEHDGRLITLFSAPNYCDVQGNLGAYINVQSSGELNFTTFAASPHPNVPAMAHAGGVMQRMMQGS